MIYCMKYTKIIMQLAFRPVNSWYQMKALLQHIRPGAVYRRSDLEFYSSAIDRHLALLTQDGTLVKLSQGLYYAPTTSRFGPVPPDERVLIERFLNSTDFLLVKPNAYNTLGLGLTQIYNTTWVYNHKRKGEFQLNGNTFEFVIKSSFPDRLTKEFLLVDLLNNLDVLADDQQLLLKKLPGKLDGFATDELLKMTKLFGSGRTKKVVKSLLRNLYKHV